MSNRVLIIDNYDSFTYNLVQYLGELAQEVVVWRNDATLDDIRAEAPAAIVLSPGPGTPARAGVCNQVIRELGPTVPILGVCLGHECIGEVFGATVGPAPELMHGKVSRVLHSGDRLFKGVPSPFRATRYHSLAVGAASLPPDLVVIASTEDGTVMGLRHRAFPVVGVQFHPESILTEGGHALLKNFLEEARTTVAAGSE